jgi:hypothetical protein
MVRLVQRGILVLACGATLAGIGASPAAAQPPVTASADPSEAPLTVAQQQARAAKLAIARREELHPGSTAGKLRPAASCPFSVSPASASTESAFSVSPNTSCGNYWGYVVTYPRVQENSTWCGVATVQVVSNYVWRMAPGANKWTQTKITGWTRTDGSGTGGSYESYGLNMADAGSPYLPAYWSYRNAYASELANGGSSWHSLLRTDIGYYSMPQVVSVSPKDPDLAYFLNSWRNPRIPYQYAGHYIVLNAWSGVWDGSRNPTVSYDDSAFPPAGVADVDPAYDMWQMIKKTNVNKTGIYVGW